MALPFHSFLKIEKGFLNKPTIKTLSNLKKKSLHFCRLQSIKFCYNQNIITQNLRFFFP